MCRRSFEDLLKPGLKGKMAITAAASSNRVVGTMAKYKGEEFINKLKNQELKLFKVASDGLLDLMIAGEMPPRPRRFAMG